METKYAIENIKERRVRDAPPLQNEIGDSSHLTTSFMYYEDKSPRSPDFKVTYRGEDEPNDYFTP